MGTRAVTAQRRSDGSQRAALRITTEKTGRVQGWSEGGKNGRVEKAPNMREYESLGVVGLVILPALAGSDKDGARLEFKCVVTLLRGQVQVEGRIGCWPRCLREEGWWRNRSER